MINGLESDDEDLLRPVIPRLFQSCCDEMDPVLACRIVF